VIFETDQLDLSLRDSIKLATAWLGFFVGQHKYLEERRKIAELMDVLARAETERHLLRDRDAVLGEPGGPYRLGELHRRLVRDSPLHWLGPSCGVMHMATGAMLNACWDLAARRAGQPLWLLLAGLSPEEITGLVDFRYLSDALTPDEAIGLLERGAAGRAERVAILRRDGYPAYSTAPGWLGYSDQRLAALCAEAVDEGFTQVKLKVGAALQDDKRRCAIAREVLSDIRSGRLALAIT